MRITVCLPDQTLVLHDDQVCVRNRYQISTAKKGPGELRGSFCTPRGHHIIRAKIGAQAPLNTVFVGRRPTGEIWSKDLGEAFPERDWMLTRILWLSGKQPGKNRLGECDTMRRYIYLHGSPETAVMGVPGSIGCVRLRNQDIIDLFDAVPVLTRVDLDDFRIECGEWTVMQADARPLREQVFVVEQGVPSEIEIDEFDASSQHAVAYDGNGKPIGTGRLLPDGHIGRMAVAADQRGEGVGRALLMRLMDTARTLGFRELRLNAQTHAAGFYQQFGFAKVGEVFIEAGIDHFEMKKALA
ncbi:MAG: GNAT family N-acetyltransferase [Rhodocyclaceae bacterium]|nr:GNAT family N-acetyltransferase [Rhodocyclaceae bacterium]